MGDNDKDTLLGSMEVRRLLARKDGVLHSPRVYKEYDSKVDSDDGNVSDDEFQMFELIVHRSPSVKSNRKRP